MSMDRRYQRKGTVIFICDGCDRRLVVGVNQGWPNAMNLRCVERIGRCAKRMASGVITVVVVVQCLVAYLGACGSVSV